MNSPYHEWQSRYTVRAAGRYCQRCGHDVNPRRWAEHEAICRRIQAGRLIAQADRIVRGVA